MARRPEMFTQFSVFTTGVRFAYMIETMFGLARLGNTNANGMPDPLQLALTAHEFSDVIVFRKPPAPCSAQSSASSHDCALARLSRDLPAALTHAAGVAKIGVGLR